MEQTLDCQSTLKQFANRQFDRWLGLSPSCTRVDLDMLFPRVDDWTGTGMLGVRQYDYTWLTVAGYEENIRAWFDGELLVSLEVEEPELPDPSRLLSQLGEPGVRLDAYRYTVHVKGAEWVYAQRGLSVFVYPSDGDIYHLTVYPPCTLEKYMSDFRPNLKVTRIPLNR